MRWITVQEAAKRTSLSEQSVRKLFQLTHFGRNGRVWEGDLLRLNADRVRALLDGDPGLKTVFNDYVQAGAVVEHLTPDPDALAHPDMAALILSSVAACRLDHPDWELVGDGAVSPAFLARLKANPPQGGGTGGAALRALISAA